MLRFNDAQAPTACAGGENGIIVEDGRREGDCGVGVGLVVCGFCLDLAEEYIACIVQLIFIELVVLNRCSYKPYSSRNTFYQEASACIDGDLP